MKSIVLIIFSILIFSCSNVALETEPLKIESVEEGKILSKGDIFDISIDRLGSSNLVSPTHSIVYITPVDNGSRAALNTKPIKLNIDLKENPNPQFRITDEFENGLYDLKIEVHDSSGLISEKSVEFIIYSEEIDISVSAYYPSKGLYPNSKVILKSSVDSRSSINPYLVWRYNNIVIQEGFLSENADLLVWDSSNHVGFNDIRVDLFPYKLSDVEINSKYYTNFSILVNPIGKQLYSMDLLSSYHKYIGFNGNYIDENNKDLDIEVYGEVLPELERDFYGLRINDENGFSSPDSLFPVTNDGFSNFSIIIDALFEEGSNEPFLYNSHGKLGFKLYFKSGSLINEFLSNNTVIESVDVAFLDPGVPVKLTISLIEVGTGFRVLYYLNGTLVQSRSVELGRAILGEYLANERFFRLSGGSTLLGSLYVYNRNNDIYPDIINDLVLYLRHDSPIFSEGFNSTYLPSALSGSGDIDGETLKVDTGSSLFYSDILPVNTDFTLTIRADEGSQYELTFSDSDSEIKRDVEGSVTVKRRNDRLFLDDHVVDGWKGTYSNLTLKAKDRVKLDSITVFPRDNRIESSF